MKHFGYSEEDYKNLSLAFSVLLDKDKVPSYVTTKDLIISQGILKTVDDAIKENFLDLHFDRAYKGVLKEEVHNFIFLFLAGHDSRLKELLWESKDESWNQEFASCVDQFSKTFKTTANKEPLNF